MQSQYSNPQDLIANEAARASKQAEANAAEVFATYPFDSANYSRLKEQAKTLRIKAAENGYIFQA